MQASNVGHLCKNFNRTKSFKNVQKVQKTTKTKTSQARDLPKSFLLLLQKVSFAFPFRHPLVLSEFWSIQRIPSVQSLNNKQISQNPISLFVFLKHFKLIKIKFFVFFSFCKNCPHLYVWVFGIYFGFFCMFVSLWYILRMRIIIEGDGDDDLEWIRYKASTKREKLN